MGRFRNALAPPGLGAIAEVKRRSPSAGDLRPDADAAALAKAFEESSAAAVSVLVDERFGGSFADLQAARAATTVPLLAKGFFRDQGDLLQSRIAGADAALLLLRDLNDEQARIMLEGGRTLGLDMLVEAHDAAELERAVALGADVIGVNARDLGTFAIDRRAQLELVARAPHDRVVVAESAIGSRAQGAEAELAGADAILVGSALMRADDPAAKLVRLRAGERVATVVDLPWLGEDEDHWERAADVEGRVVLAGGLGPDNVRRAVEAVRPWCVDASPSLEARRGVKDHGRVRAFVDAVRSLEAVRS